MPKQGQEIYSVLNLEVFTVSLVYLLLLVHVHHHHHHHITLSTSTLAT